jgi:hypothetical protein
MTEYVGLDSMNKTQLLVLVAVGARDRLAWSMVCARSGATGPMCVS